MKYLLLFLLFISCTKKEVSKPTEPLPKITTDTKTDITIWGWNVAANGLEALVPEFNKLYPNITINIIEFGSSGATLEKSQVALNSGKGMPNLLQVESDYVQTYAETYPQRFLDMNPYFDPSWEKTMDPSKIAVSYDTEGRLVSIPWDSGPVVLFYRDDYFKQAGIDPDSIKTWDDYIMAGKKLQKILTNVKMTGFGYTGDDGLWRILMTQAGVYYLNKNNQITITKPEAQEALELVRKIGKEIALDTSSWTGLIQSAQIGSVATYIIGGWWSGTLKDQIPKLAGKWRIMKIPSYKESTIRSSSQGGSTLMLLDADPLQQAVSLAFLKFALTSIDNQLTMFNQFGLFPSYIPVYSDKRFLQGDPYFGGQNINEILGEVVTEIPPVIYNSDKYAEIRNIAVTAFERALNTEDDLSVVLEETAKQIQSTTGKDIAP